MAEFTVRPVDEHDRSIVLTLWNELSEYYLSLNPIFPIRWNRPEDPQRRIERIDRLWSDPQNHIGFLAEVGGEPAGFCRAAWSSDGPAAASIHTLYVRPDFRANGIGNALMSASIAWCKEHGANDVSLDVLPSNVVADRFHRSNGFEPFITSYVKRLD